MKNRMILGFMAGLLGSVLVGTSAHALLLEPGDETATTNDNSNCTSTCFPQLVGFTELYKAEVDPSGEEGSLAGSYETTFSNTSSDPSDFSIQYVSGPIASCVSSTCYLLVKDGNQEPAQYLFNITGWNGTDEIEGKGFWPNQGAISHVSIYGTSTSVPEPTSLLLLGAGLAGLGIWRWKQA